ncbi:MAG: tetratricopeptide repeat protein [Bacteroidetes bacterium]|jgi:tetratricopeptide (TPR) repeat protein|nr:tetratricopeptide repeat protein [Bacteroidota bacterium]
MSASSKSIITVAAAIVLVFLFFLLPRYKKPADSAPVTSVITEFDFAGFEKMAVTELKQQDKTILDSLLSDSKSGNTDSLISFWDRHEKPGISAFYAEQRAKKDITEKNYINAAFRYFDAYKAAKDSLSEMYFVNKAIACYTEVLKINPENLNAKTDLGICYAESAINPMQGITLLKEVVAKDPNHENAQLNLGFLSVRSRQYDKALERFNTVLKINPSRVDMYVFIGQTYLEMGNKEEAIKNFETFKSLSNNTQALAQIDAYLKELKTKP